MGRCAVIKTSLNPQGTFKVIGELETEFGPARIEVGANGTLVVSIAGGRRYPIALPIVIALQHEATRAFVADPVISAYLYAANERETRVNAAQALANAQVQDKIRDLAMQFMKLGVPEAKAWTLARLEFQGP